LKTSRLLKNNMNDKDMPILGEKLIAAFKADVENFFPENINFQLNIEKDGLNPPRCKGVGCKTRIMLPNIYYEKEVGTYEEMALMIVVLGHEAAHFLNRHNEHNDESSLESQSIEMWADYYGVILALVAITFGQNIQLIADSFKVESSMKFRIQSFASAFSMLANTYFANSHPDYPSAGVRVSTCIAGVLSFFEKIFTFQALQRGDIKEAINSQTPKVIVERAFRIQQWIYENTDLMKLCTEPSTDQLSSEQVKLIAKIHREIQSKQKPLFESMNAVPAQWLRRSFDIPEEERHVMAKERLATLEKTLESLGLGSSALDEYRNKRPSA